MKRLEALKGCARSGRPEDLQPSHEGWSRPMRRCCPPTTTSSRPPSAASRTRSPPPSLRGALLVLPNATDSFGASMGLEDFEPRPLSPAEISGSCARHELALVALCGFWGRTAASCRRSGSSSSSSRRFERGRPVSPAVDRGDAKTLPVPGPAAYAKRCVKRTAHKAVNRGRRYRG